MLPPKINKQQKEDHPPSHHTARSVDEKDVQSAGLCVCVCGGKLGVGRGIVVKLIVRRVGRGFPLLTSSRHRGPSFGSFRLFPSTWSPLPPGRGEMGARRCRSECVWETTWFTRPGTWLLSICIYGERERRLAVMALPRAVMATNGSKVTFQGLWRFASRRASGRVDRSFQIKQTRCVYSLSLRLSLPGKKPPFVVVN